jgi:ABC-type proline/glycine betaine transport system ATPase subunit
MDEVLSVGDENFRHKMFQRINSITSNGTSVVLATHSLNDVMKFCNKCMLMEKGTIASFAHPGETISKYMGSSLRQNGEDSNGVAGNSGQTDKTWGTPQSSPGTEFIRLKRISIQAKSKSETEKITTGDTIEVEVQFWKLKARTTIQLHLVFFDKLDNPILSTAIFHNSNNVNLHKVYEDETGVFKMVCEVPQNFLYKGDYSIQLRFGRDVNVEEYIYKSDISFTIHPSPCSVDYIGDDLPISVRPVFFWRHEKIADN